MTSVLIVGAGPTGLTAALELSRLGVDVRIVDKAAEPSPTSRALGVQARTLELLRPRGVADELLRLGNRAYRTALHANGDHLASIDFSHMPSEFNFILMLAQSETERLLADRLRDQGVRVERGVAFESLTQDDTGVRTVLRHADGRTEVAPASYVIAADGSHSPIRKALGLPFEGGLDRAELRARRRVSGRRHAGGPALDLLGHQRFPRGLPDGRRPLPLHGHRPRRRHRRRRRARRRRTSRTCTTAPCTSLHGCTD